MECNDIARSLKWGRGREHRVFIAVLSMGGFGGAKDSGTSHGDVHQAFIPST